MPGALLFDRSGPLGPGAAAATQATKRLAAGCPNDAGRVGYLIAGCRFTEIARIRIDPESRDVVASHVCYQQYLPIGCDLQVLWALSTARYDRYRLK